MERVAQKAELVQIVYQTPDRVQKMLDKNDYLGAMHVVDKNLSILAKELKGFKHQKYQNIDLNNKMIEC